MERPFPLSETRGREDAKWTKDWSPGEGGWLGETMSPGSGREEERIFHCEK